MPCAILIVHCFVSGLLIGILCLMIMSTCYDIWCTLKQGESTESNAKSLNNNHYNYVAVIFITEPKTQTLVAFSVYTNASKLLSYDPPKSRNVMQCLHGIRVISTQWVVLAHTYAALIALPSQNPIYYVEVMFIIVQFNQISNIMFNCNFFFSVCLKIYEYDNCLCEDFGRYIPGNKWFIGFVYYVKTSWKNVCTNFIDKSSVLIRFNS